MGIKNLKVEMVIRIRIGNYRVIYDIFDTKLVIEVVTPRYRKDIYN